MTLARAHATSKQAKKVLVMHRDGLSYLLIGRNIGLSKNTVMENVRRGVANGIVAVPLVVSPVPKRT